MLTFLDRRYIGSFDGRALVVDYACKPDILYVFNGEIIGPTETFLREWTEHKPDQLREILADVS